MNQFETSIEIDEPVDKVYAYLAGLTRHSEWSRRVDKPEPLTAGPIRVGSEFRASETIPARFYSYTRLTALDPPHRIAWASTDHRVLKTEWEFEFAATATGTNLTQRARFEGLHLPGKMILRYVIQPKVAKDDRASLERIKDALENTAGGSH